MANYKGHIVGGLIFTAAYAGAVSFLPLASFTKYAGIFSEWQAVLAVFIIGILFALFPDVDTNSKAQDIFFGIVFPLDIFLIWQGMIQAAAYLGLIAMLPIVGHHRGWTHKKWAMFVVPLPLLLVPYLYMQEVLVASVVFYFAAIAGYFSHLFLDGLIIKSFRIKN